MKLFRFVPLYLPPISIIYAHIIWSFLIGTLQFSAFMIKELPYCSGYLLLLIKPGQYSVICSNSNHMMYLNMWDLSKFWEEHLLFCVCVIQLEWLNEIPEHPLSGKFTWLPVLPGCQLGVRWLLPQGEQQNMRDFLLVCGSIHWMYGLPFSVFCVWTLVLCLSDIHYSQSQSQIQGTKDTDLSIQLEEH